MTLDEMLIEELNTTSNKSNLDANGHTPEDIACFNDPNCDQNQRLLSLLYQDVTGTGAGELPCGSNGVPCGPIDNGFPSWGWLLLALGGGFLAIELVARR